MDTSDLLQTLEFLILFFSVPEKSFFKEIYAGRTPVGEVTEGEPFEDFYTNASTAVTLLFVNSPQGRPVYPLATEFMDDSKAKEQFIDELSSQYQSAGKVVVSHPPDHIIVLLEFLYSLLQEEKLPDVQKFYEQFIENWTNHFTAAILKRKPPKCISQVAKLIDRLGEQINEVCGYGYLRQE